MIKIMTVDEFWFSLINSDGILWIKMRVIDDDEFDNFGDDKKMNWQWKQDGLMLIHDDWW